MSKNLSDCHDRQLVSCATVALYFLHCINRALNSLIYGEMFCWFVIFVFNSGECQQITGTMFGTPGSWANDPSCTFDKAWDGSTATYFDGVSA